MALLSEKDVQYLKRAFEEQLKDKVKILLFVDDATECEYCDLTNQVLNELASIDNRIEVTTYHIKRDKEVAQRYNIDKTPAIVMLDKNGNDTRIRFFGIPSGHEFSTLLQDIVAVSTGKPVLFNQKQIEEIKSINKPVNIKVFVTPTCPYCPKAVLLAHMAALVNPNIVGEMIEANEFPELSIRYGIASVPHTFINDKVDFIGAYPEGAFIRELLRAVGGA
ncbi:protein disulfide oxidoreductase [Pseudothermotoga thermarum]|uniref:Glutaredoxin-like domain protein n=1 Tax=Pseudothermotoga thermarum DSM 5069 TaxID=688269 RepID=F7YTP9_9THEM|nr:thioredoxin family protein [Pseudothermotoga thermarum]AEH51272.1 glutaredoxin-like domain protein [Pseudothermotoga thermarum DSM 5069]